MNISISSSKLALTSAFIAAAALVATSTSTLAQGKGAELLVATQRASSRPAAAPRSPAPATERQCPKCENKLTRVAQPLGKGGRIETASVIQHQCPKCGDKIETVGVGKQATSVVKHTCQQADMASANCCRNQHVH